MLKQFWQVRMLAGGTGEIRLYGEIVSRRPVNWWTGEPADGLFISPEGFLEDLERIRSCGVITLRVNSPGGDVATGQAIYSLLKDLPGRKVGIVDSLAASAATLPLMACEEIQIPAGARIMVHEASVQYGDGLTLDQLARLTAMLEATNQAAAETYHAKTGHPVSDIRAQMRAVTWMTGRQAVESGWADTLLHEDTEEAVQLTADGKYLVAGGETYSTRMFASVPDDIPVKRGGLQGWLKGLTTLTIPPLTPEERREMKGMLAADGDMRLLTERTGGEKMIRTLEDLMKEYPDLCASLREEGVAQERQRLQAIDAMKGAGGYPALVEQAKYGDQPLTAPELAMAVLEADSGQGKDFLAGLRKDAARSGAAAVHGAPNGGSALTEEEERMALARGIAGVAKEDGANGN